MFLFQPRLILIYSLLWVSVSARVDRTKETDALEERSLVTNPLHAVDANITKLRDTADSYANNDCVDDRGTPVTDCSVPKLVGRKKKPNPPPAPPAPAKTQKPKPNQDPAVPADTPKPAANKPTTGKAVPTAKSQPAAELSQAASLPVRILLQRPPLEALGDRLEPHRPPRLPPPRSSPFVKLVLALVVLAPCPSNLDKRDLRQSFHVLYLQLRQAQAS